MPPPTCLNWLRLSSRPCPRRILSADRHHDMTRSIAHTVHRPGLDSVKLDRCIALPGRNPSLMKYQPKPHKHIIPPYSTRYKPQRKVDTPYQSLQISTCWVVSAGDNSPASSLPTSWSRNPSAVRRYATRVNSVQQPSSRERY